VAFGVHSIREFYKTSILWFDQQQASSISYHLHYPKLKIIFYIRTHQCLRVPPKNGLFATKTKISGKEYGQPFVFISTFKIFDCGFEFKHNVNACIH